VTLILTAHTLQSIVSILGLGLGISPNLVDEQDRLIKYSSKAFPKHEHAEERERPRKIFETLNSIPNGFPLEDLGSQA